MEFEALDEPLMDEEVEPEAPKDYDILVIDDEEFERHCSSTPATEETLADSSAHREAEKQADTPGADSFSSVTSFEPCSPSKVTTGTVSSDPWDQECEEDEETLLAAMEEYENSDPIVGRESDCDQSSNSEEDPNEEKFVSIKTLQSMADEQGKDVFDPTITGDA